MRPGDAPRLREVRRVLHDEGQLEASRTMTRQEGMAGTVRYGSDSGV